MSVWGNVVMALRGISSNWLRSLLTMLGVLIGVASVIVLLAVGTGSSQAVESQIDKLGTNTLTVFSSGRFGGGTSQTGTQSRNATLPKFRQTPLTRPTGRLPTRARGIPWLGRASASPPARQRTVSRGPRASRLDRLWRQPVLEQCYRCTAPRSGDRSRRCCLNQAWT